MAAQVFYLGKRIGVMVESRESEQAPAAAALGGPVTGSFTFTVLVPNWEPKPLTLTSVQIRAWRRGESVFRVARPKRRRLPRVPMWDRRTVQWAAPVGEPITLTPKQIREWRRG